MKLIVLVILINLISCKSGEKVNHSIEEIKNESMKKREILDCMYRDSYFPKFMVDKCSQIFINLCFEIETKEPKDLKELYELTHNATIELNNLEDEFYEAGSEIETGARECFGTEFEFICKTYNFKADIEEAMATRTW